MKIEVGRSYLFKYPYYGTPDSFPDYTQHSGQVVVVVRQLGADENENDYPMFEVKAVDGWTGHVVGDELSRA